MYYNSTKSINSTKGVFGSRHGAHIDVPKTSAGKMLAAKLAALDAKNELCRGQGTGYCQMAVISERQTFLQSTAKI
jgi:hypothetical protein